MLTPRRHLLNTTRSFTQAYASQVPDKQQDIRMLTVQSMVDELA